MIELDVWLTTPRNQVLQAGRIVVAPPDPSRGGRLDGQFRYLRSYLRDEKAIPLDPVNLPLSPGTFPANRPHAGVHGVFEDSLPDQWGRRLLCRRHGLTGEKTRVPSLLQHIGAYALGGLSYAKPAAAPAPPLDIEKVDVERVIEAAMKLEAGEEPPQPELACLLHGGSSPGGARPKILARYQGREWLVKMPSVNDTMDVQALEAGCLALAREAGIETPVCRYLPAGKHSFLLVERFDVTPWGGRNHVVSHQTLLRADHYYNLAYRDVGVATARTSSEPRRDLRRLCRQMAFNAMIGNTDDHLKNFCMLRTEEGWRLSPAYDLLTCIHKREHVLRINSKDMGITGPDLVAEGKAMGLRHGEVQQIVQETGAAVARWRDFIGDHLPDSMPILERRIWQPPV